MKCVHCDSEWKTNEKNSASMTKCPFCGENPQVREDQQSIENSKDALAAIYKKFGADVLLGDKLKSYFSDFAPSVSKNIKELVYAVYNKGASNVLKQNLNSSQEDKERAVKIAIRNLTEAFISLEAAENIIFEFIGALGWQVEKPKQEPTEAEKKAAEVEKKATKAEAEKKAAKAEAEKKAAEAEKAEAEKKAAQEAAKKVIEDATKKAEEAANKVSSTPSPSPTPVKPTPLPTPINPSPAPSTTIPANFVYIKGGTFMMGSPAYEPGHRNSETQHQVTVSSFYMCKFTVTQKEYREVIGVKISKFRDNLPIEQVTWFEAIEYCNKLSRKEGLTPAYTIDNNKTVTWNRKVNGYRLPTEAEWEYACRAGTTTAYNTRAYFTYNKGWYKKNSGGTTHPIGQKPANAWGLYDMHGNVWEWCWDWYGDYISGAQTDPTGAFAGTYRVLRGGSWHDPAEYTRSASRLSRSPALRDRNVGFRVVRS